MISQSGAVNVNALSVPGGLVQIVPPDQFLIRGAVTNRIGIVGGASWGPLNSPTNVSGYQEAVQKFGPGNSRKYDLITHVQTAGLQGANNFVCIRISSGGDAAATIVVLTNCITFTGFYTGNLGNSITVTTGPATAKKTATRVVVACPGYAPEVFDNITGVGVNRWVNIAAAINNGQSDQRGPSKLIVATAGVGVTAPAVAAYTLSGGVDGAGSITATHLLGQDTTPRTGMYALRNTGCPVFLLADCDDSTSWATQIAYGLGEGSFPVLVGPSGDTVANAVTAVATAAIDTYNAKYLHGDWIWFRDQRNNQTRLVSPQGFWAGRRATLGPQDSTLNKPIQGIVGTQATAAQQVYSDGDLQTMALNGIDLISGPSPGGKYFSTRLGLNCSTDPTVNTETYTTMTNFLAVSLNTVAGRFVGQLQTPPQRRAAKATFDAFLQDLADQGVIGNANGTTPFSVQLDANNNSATAVALGREVATIQVTYLSVVRNFIVNVQGGQTVVIVQPVAA
jgi:hypothetical protein